MSVQTKHLYEFGSFCLDAAKRRLLRDGEVVKLTPKAFETLLALVEQQGKTVEELDAQRDPEWWIGHQKKVSEIDEKIRSYSRAW